MVTKSIFALSKTVCLLRKPFLLFLTLFLLFSCRSQPSAGEAEFEAAGEPGIEVKAPEFEVISIVILQADIVVTEFEATLKITNPNEFGLELASLSYNLYGNGAFWADGLRDELLEVPPLASIETNFLFTMNFIGMRRNLLDDVIAMRQVYYLFTGNAEIRPDLPGIDPFRITFNCSGYSQVIRRPPNQNTPAQRRF